MVVLASCFTASAAEGFLSAVKYAKRGVIVGEASYGSSGQPFMGGLPGGGYYGVCTQKVEMPDGTDYNNVGVAPDLAVENSADDLRNGYDRVFGAGLRALRERTDA
jgi:C-terminal processing protease CtpA/Prc